MSAAGNLLLYEVIMAVYMKFLTHQLLSYLRKRCNFAPRYQSGWTNLAACNHRKKC